MDYKIGDKVRITSEWDDDMDGTSATNSNMIKRYGGEIMTIRSVVNHDGVPYFRMQEDNSYWSWSRSMIQGIAQVNPVAPKQMNLPQI